MIAQPVAVVGRTVVLDGVAAATTLAGLEPMVAAYRRRREPLPRELVSILEALRTVAPPAPASARPATSASDDDAIDDRWVSSAEAAVLLGVSTRQVRRLVEVGDLIGRVVAGRLMLDADDVDALASQRRRAGLLGTSRDHPTGDR